MNDRQPIKHYFHSVRLIEEKCKGCVNCIKYCPTEAIRVREGKAQIMELKCVDCGECIRICQNKAKTTVADSLDMLSQFKYNIALPAPALFGQFRGGVKPEKVISGLLKLGFDDIFEVGYAAEMVSAGIREILKDPDRPKPLLSSSCPAIIRLIQVRFPEYIGHIAPIVSPMRLSARLARKQASEEQGIPPEEIGLFFISPCPGKVSAIVDPVGFSERCIDGAIPIADIYAKLHNYVYDTPDENIPDKVKQRASGIGMGWARSGGEILSIGAKKHISVDGIHNVIQIMEEIEHGKLLDMDYIEVGACVGGCVGGVLNVENPFITRRRIRDLATTEGLSPSDDDIAARQLELVKDIDPAILRFDNEIQPRPTLSLDDDMTVAIEKMEKLEEILESLPGLDCGSCGAPNCRALAEDMVRGLAVETDCIFKLRERVRELAGELQGLAEKLPPAMRLDKKEDTHHDAVNNGN
ncbi:MAG: [Fe-Fe] hydrogenase large subunit C-terminal domain-containing protein [Armatimonadota bacterium]